MGRRERQALLTNTHDRAKFAPDHVDGLQPFPARSTLGAMGVPLTSPDETAEDNLRLVAQMRPALVKYFKRKSGSAAEAEDLAQDVLMRALTHARWTSASQAKGYIFRAAVNRWRDRQRRFQVRGRTVAWDEEATLDLSAENPPERVLIIKEELAQVLDALDAMSERTQAVLMMIRLERMRAATVADILGISESAVNKHLAKGLARLAALRRKQDGT